MHISVLLSTTLWVKMAFMTAWVDQRMRYFDEPHTYIVILCVQGELRKGIDAFGLKADLVRNHHDVISSFSFWVR
jgi:hypothetical protein